ncbi:chromate transporter [Legionella beliardensis]|uniref:Chromate transporter n=1 Tax=Legionella beliardensis TaxID=91822 RepID=A0A378I5H1_9GAMM|nr:chromate transporter [Legionella beliardensis]STX27724.1 chromate transporter [Legionella beliardensis]
MISNLLTLIVSFGKIGLISLGGGNSMLKLIEVEAVDYRHWISNEEFIGMLGSSFLFPGLTAVKLAALIGYKAAGLLGLAFAVISINLPGLILAGIGYQLLSQHSGPTVQKIMVPVQYGALVLLAATAFSVAQGIMNVYYSVSMVIMSILFFIALTYLQLSPFWGFIAFIGICFFLVH